MEELMETICQYVPAIQHGNIEELSKASERILSPMISSPPYNALIISTNQSNIYSHSPSFNPMPQPRNPKL